MRRKQQRIASGLRLLGEPRLIITTVVEWLFRAGAPSDRLDMHQDDVALYYG
jgi:hypothetical protein